VKILITGGCGFIGINLIALLQQETSHHVIVIDNLSLGKREYLEKFEVEFIEGDIRDKPLINRVMRKIDAVIHLAADTRVIDSIAQPEFNFDVNVNGTYNLLSAAREAGVNNFIFASTGGAIIGDAEPPVHEGMVPRPISPYGASKLCGEAYCSAFAGSYGMKTISLRFSNVYGPYSYHKGSVVATFFKRILRNEPLTVYGDGNQTRDFIFSRDLCAAIVNALEVKEGGEVYQLGSGIPTSINQLISEIKGVVGPNYDLEVQYENFRTGEVKFNYAKIDKALRDLNFSLGVSLTQGLTHSWGWFLKKMER
jgi:UDP-glucose 4-epimerase